MEAVVFKARPKAVVHNGKISPIRFDTRGIYTTSDSKEIELLRSRHYVTELQADGEPEKKETKAEKKETKAEKKASEAAEKGADAGDAGADGGEKTHVLTKEDFEANPSLAEKYKVGDTVNLSGL